MSNASAYSKQYRPQLNLKHTCKGSLENQGGGAKGVLQGVGRSWSCEGECKRDFHEALSWHKLDQTDRSKLEAEEEYTWHMSPSRIGSE